MSDTMTHCLLVGAPGGGGEEVFVRHLAEHPPRDTRYSLVLGYHESAPGARARPLEEKVFNRLVHPLIWPLPGLRSLRVDGTDDLVHVHNVLHRIRPADVPIVMSLGGGTYWHYLTGYLGWEEARVERHYRRAGRVLRLLGIANEFTTWERLRGILVFSRFAGEHLVRAGVPEERVAVVPPGFETPPERPSASADRPFTFLAVGRHPHRKGFDLVVEAFRGLRRSRDVRLILVGDSNYEELSNEPGIEGLGWVDRKSLMEDLMPSSDALLLPSRVEGYGFVAVEAMGHGLAVVGSRQAAIPEILDQGRAGLLVTPGEVADLRDAMVRLVDEPGLASGLGGRARARFLEEYTLERFHARLATFYGRAVRQEPVGRPDAPGAT